MDAQRNKKIRGWIVRILQRAYPAGLETETLGNQLEDLGYSVAGKDLEASLAYLNEDGFIEKIEFGKPFDGLTTRFYKLTTKGIDLAEKTISDTGVDL